MSNKSAFVGLTVSTSWAISVGLIWLADLALYQETAPHNIEFDGSSKGYRIGNSELDL